MQDWKIESANRQIRFVTILGIGCNIVLSVLKMGVGFFGHSLALVADGLHSLSDMVTDFAVLLGIHFGSKRPDESHPYGHGRIETFSAAFIGLILAAVGCGMIYKGGIDIARGKFVQPGFVVLIAALISIIAKELLYRVSRKVAVRSHSSALYANAWHHRSDALSSVVVVAGFVSLRLGFKYGDQIAAIGVGLMIILAAVKIISSCLSELTESAVDSDTIERIKSIINADSAIHRWHKLRTRTVGREVFLDLHILVAPDLNISAAHQISEGLEKALHEQMSRPVNITVHIEPDLPEL